MPLCFAYGANMDVEAMASRCPRSKPLGVARLPGHRFALTRRLYAHASRDPRREVWGLLWSMAFADLAALDRWEEVDAGLYARTTRAVIRAAGGPVQAFIYLARDPDAPGPLAPPAYGVDLLRAACRLRLPSSHLGALQAALSGAAPALGGRS